MIFTALTGIMFPISCLCPAANRKVQLKVVHRKQFSCNNDVFMSDFVYVPAPAGIFFQKNLLKYIPIVEYLLYTIISSRVGLLPDRNYALEKRPAPGIRI